MAPQKASPWIADHPSDSDQADGSTYSVDLTRVAEAEGADQPAGVDVLVVEDDPTIRQALAEGLKRAGFTVRVAEDGPSGLASFFRQTPRLVLLDVMLPGVDGIAACRTIRSSGTVPVIMLTARSDDDDVVAGLQAGADDYVVKPFSPPVLFARIHSVLRRSTTDGDTTLTAGRFVVDTVTASVSRSGQRVALTPTEYRLFAELARHRGAVRTRDELLSAVWDYSWSGDERLVDVHVQRLRAKVGSDVIETVWGQGYRFHAG